MSIDFDLEDEIMHRLDFCGCGEPGRVVKCMREYLNAVAIDDFDDRGDRISDMLHDDAYLIMAYICDQHGLTDHGTSILGAWITRKGEEWLDLLNKEDSINE